MAKTKLIIVGASGHSKVIIDVFEKMKNHEILGLFDDFVAKDSEMLGYRVLGKINEITPFLSVQVEVKVFIAIGDNWTRSLIKKKLIADHPNIQWAQAIHPFSQIGKGTILGNGVAVLAGAVINSDSKLGDFSIMGSNSNLDHESQLGNFASIAPGCTTGGNVRVGSYSAIGLGTNITHGRSIGSHTVIGAGSTVLQDIGDSIVAYGTPAKKIRSRANGERYL